MPDAAKKAVITALNRAVAKDWFTGREGKKKGCDVAWLLQDGPTVERFLAVWQQEKLT